jgi:WD40 repeat protein
MAFASVPDLVQALRALRLLEPEQLAEVERVQARFADPLSLARDLMQRNWLTAYQVNLLFAGRGQELVLGSYLVLQRLGEGGMGQVFKARHQRLGRVVALKVIRKDRLANPEAVKRFGREVQVAAQIDHPNVVRAYDADDVGGTLFFAMEHVEGTDLTRLVRQHGPLSVALACDYVRQAALGLDGCSQAGLVHRDIKPSNLLVVVPRPGDSPVRVAGSTSGHVVKLLDLGLARLTEPGAGEQATRLTQLGSVLGTPDFLAPEQARDSRSVDIRADLYSLGCTLYYILTGKTPFGEGTTMEKLLRHQIEQAPPLEQVRPEVPPELGAVVRKLMAKRPDDRYQTPLEVAVALEPFTHRVSPRRQQGKPQPVLAAIPLAAAGPAPAAAVPAAVPIAAAIQPAAATAALAGATPRSAVPAAPAARRPVQRASWRTFRALGATVLLGGLLLGLLLVSHPWSGSGSSAGNGAPPGGGREQPSPLDKLDPARIPPQALLLNQPREVVAVLGDPRLRHWAPAQHVAVHPKLGQVASAGADGTVRVWDAQTGAERHAFHEPDGTILGLGFRGADRLLAVFHQPGKGLRVSVWDLKKDKAHLVVKGVPGLPVVALAPGGKFLAAAFWKPEKDGEKPATQVRVWNLDNGEEKKTLTDPARVSPLALSADGKTLALAAEKGVRLLDVDEGKEKAVLKGHEGPVGLLAFAPDGTTLASTAAVTRDKTAGTEVKLWKPESNEAQSTFWLPGQVGALAIGAEGKSLALGLTRGGAPEVRLWRVADPREPKEVHNLGGYAAVVAELALDPAGKMLVTAAGDNAVRLWDLDSGKERVEHQGQRGPVLGVAFAPDGRALAFSNGSPDQGVRLWDPATGKERALHKGGWAPALAYLAGGKVLAASAPGAVTLLDAGTGRERATVRGRWAVAPDGSVLATVGPDEQSLQLWDGAARDKEIGTLPGHAKAVKSLAFAPDGRLLASGAEDGEVKLWDLSTRRARQMLPGLKGPVVCLAFAPDGRLLAASGQGVVKLWEVQSGKERPALPETAPGKPATNLTFSPDGKTLYAWGVQGVKAWDAESEQARPLLQGQDGQIRTVALSPEGRRLVTVTQDGRLQVWDPATGGKLQELVLPGPVQGVAFAPDGRHLATANGNGTVYILRLPAGSAEASPRIAAR